MSGQGRRRDYGHADMDLVDELAVRWACQGTAMRLNRDEQVAAVTLMLGQIPAKEIARRINTHPMTVHRIVTALDTIRCPLCRCNAFHTDGVLARHIMDHPQAVGWCPMSGSHHADEVALDARRGWLNQSDRPSSARQRARRLAAAS